MTIILSTSNPLTYRNGRVLVKVVPQLPGGCIVNGRFGHTGFSESQFMPIRNLDKIFAPKSVAVIGASQRPLSVGNTVLLNLTNGGFGGNVYPVNPKHNCLGLATCYSSVSDLPEVVDLAVICTPAKTIPDIVRQCGEAGIRGLVILSAGFREASQDGAALTNHRSELPWHHGSASLAERELCQ
jgi:predicted CoA-binding protein